MLEQFFDLAEQLHIAATLLFEVAVALVGWQLGSGVEELLDALPALRVHSQSVFGQFVIRGDEDTLYSEFGYLEVDGTPIATTIGARLESSSPSTRGERTVPMSSLLPAPFLRASFVLAMSVVALSSVRAQETAEKIESIARYAFERGAFHGGLLVAEGRQVVYRGAFGMADKAANEPNRPETVYALHSITKPFTAILILQMVAEGELDLESTLSDHLPSFPSVHADRITVHHLLCHRSGLPDYFTTIPGYLQGQPPDLTREQAMTEIAGMPLEFEPGSAFSYNNSGYVLLAQIIEELSSLTYAEALQRRILGPLEMTRTRSVDRLGGPGQAVQYGRDGGEAPSELLFGGDAGIVSTLDDMLKFTRALGTEELLPASMWKLAFTAHSRPEEARGGLPPAQQDPYGYGFSLAERPVSRGKTERAVVHGGMGLGGSSLMQHSLESGRTVLLWNNAGGIPPFLPGLDEALAERPP